MTAQPLGRPAPGVVLFASAPGDPRARRPTDVALAIVALTGLVISAVGTQIAADLGAALTALLADLPPFLDPLWLGLTWAALAWALVLLVAAAVRRRPAL